ncbi:DUF502 domain-containing protein [Halovenus salina]|uniref:DUF502 domain-containing protein n=1 Tax=Halovenus salina TaxID=1510225 RepID=A0ABD5W2X6_9EURY|nr:DUF502 domain-containing protein [Halovenus salina]
MASWKRDFASGLIILVPIVVTIAVLAWLYGYLVKIPLPVEKLAETYGLPENPLQVLLTIVLFILLVFSVGYLMRTAVGAVAESALDDLMNSLPGLRVIYNASKMAVETALSGTSELQAPVKVELWNGMRMTAFKTGNQSADGREILFLPTAPNITSGYVIEVKPDRYEEIDDSVEDAMTRLLSAGFGDTSEATVSNILPDDGGQVSVDELAEDTAPSNANATDGTRPDTGDGPGN